MDAELQRIVEERLRSDGHGLSWAPLVTAACEGSDALGAALVGRRSKSATKSTPAASAREQPLCAYLSAITVEGFRGVGPRKALDLWPGPGLTLVIGRNGSGKSSFAEALEILLTGSNWRWQFRSVIWKEGWRNLHHPSPTEVSADFAIEGQKGTTTITRSWPDGAELDDGRLDADLSALGWESALESYRPFLSYNELGSMFDEGPTKPGR